MSTARFNTLENAAGTKSVPVATVVDGSAKAWVNFNGSGTVAIRASFNVTSITDNGVGNYTVNFTTALADANFSMGASARFDTANSDGNAPFVGFRRSSAALSASSANIMVLQATTTPVGFDADVVTAAFFR
jgi:hypothetical protein